MSEPTFIPEIVRNLREPRQGVHEDGTEELKTWVQLFKQSQDAADEIMRLRERLELGYAYDGTGKRVACDIAYDGIDCRNETIKGQDEQLDKARKLALEIHSAVKRPGKGHGLIGNLECILDHVLPKPTFG